MSNINYPYDIGDVVAADDEPPLQAYKNNNDITYHEVDEYDADMQERDRLLGHARGKAQVQILLHPHKDEREPMATVTPANFKTHTGPGQLDRKASRNDDDNVVTTTTAVAVANDVVLAPARQRRHQPQPQQQRKRQQQPTTQHSENMTQYGNTQQQQQEQQQQHQQAVYNTKLDIQKFPEQYNNGGGDADVGDGAEQNVATIILTPTSLNTTNATDMAVPTRNAGTGAGAGAGAAGVDSNNGRGYAHVEPVYKGPKWWLYLVACWPAISEHLALIAIFIALWTIGYVQLGKLCLPSSALMRIILLFVGAQAVGLLVTLIRLPDMLGMLLFGVVYANVGLADFKGYERLEAFLRELALINIMLLAGLGLDGQAFKRLWLMVLRLTLVPTIAEVAVIMVLAHYTLGMPWLWGIVLGLVITAVSPNVVVTVMLMLKEQRLGLNGGIHTLIYAMTTCNDVVSIFLFSVILSVIFSTSSLTQQIVQGPIGIGVGIVFGYLYGFMLQFLPSRNAAYANGLRFVLTILGGCISVMGSRAIGYSSAGALGCVMIAFTAGLGWNRDVPKLSPDQLQAYQTANVPKRLDLLWKFLKPVSFALIGKEINFAVLEGRVVGYGALLVLLGSLFRLVFAYLSTYGGNLSRKERAYITISGFPKATVQAALGPIALDLARSTQADNAEVLGLANNVLIISVLAIIFTAPLGAILMVRLAPLWLKRSEEQEESLEPPIIPTSIILPNKFNEAKLA